MKIKDCIIFTHGDLNKHKRAPATFICVADMKVAFAKKIEVSEPEEKTDAGEPEENQPEVNEQPEKEAGP